MEKLILEVPNSFYRGEERNGYYIPKKAKELWAVELDLLNQFDIICKKFRLTYYALGGTLLGAIRHKGFIPWDNDIDLIMPRNDYNKFIELSDFKYPYFLSYPGSENRFWRKHIQLRNSSTTGYIKNDAKRNNNKGIFIDIFPLDEVPQTLEERNKHRNRLISISKWMDHKSTLEGRFWSRKSINMMLKYILTSIVVHGDKIYNKKFIAYNKELSKYWGKNTGMVGHASLSYRERGVWPAEWYKNSILYDFEFIKIPVPEKYALILDKYFGKDWLEIPGEIPDSDHGEIIFDVNRPFTEKFHLNVKD